MLPNTDETTVDTVPLESSKQSTKVADTVSPAKSESDKPPTKVEEIHTGDTSAGKTQGKKQIVEKKEEPNPLLLDPYDFDRCTITILYTRVGDRQASISVHNHKDDPLLKTFPLVEVPLPEEIACVIERLLEIWPESTVSATMVLLPQENEAERRMVVSIRAGNDTPIVLTGAASQFPLPPPIATLLHELKELFPARAMQKIENDARKRAKAGSRSTSGKTTSARSTTENVDGKTQMKLF